MSARRPCDGEVVPVGTTMVPCGNTSQDVVLQLGLEELDDPMDGGFIVRCSVSTE